MKAIHQIISYLNEYGLLTREELIALSARGFYSVESVFPTGEESGEKETTSARELELDNLTEQIGEQQGRLGRRRGGGGGARRLAVVEAEDFCECLAGHMEAWRPALSAITRLGHRLIGAKTWEEAAVAVRNAPVETLARVVMKGWELGNPSLSAIWEALNLDSYKFVLEEARLSGPAAVVYGMMLKANVHSDLGSYGTLLSHREVAAIFNLRLAQRQLAVACGLAPRRNPEKFAAILRREYHEPAYWSFVLLYNARRGRPGKRPWPRTYERRPPQLPPAYMEWPKFWAHAAGMDHPAVAPYLMERADTEKRRRDALETAIPMALSSIAPQHQTLVNDYYVNPMSPAEMARRHQRTETEILE
ncbi:MAG TPA: hypothetical protein VKS79_11440, partial [Gemmataceae bacterium]|nr:hypothetical protein [Gemmataceae bacterium]